jgi:hypothetical protein
MENEYNELIATRIAGRGDSWILIGDETEHSSLTDVLEAYFQSTGDKCNFRLEPLNSKLFAIKQNDPNKTKHFNIYGEY